MWYEGILFEGKFKITSKKINLQKIHWRNESLSY